jgi:RNA polymerase sigma factor (sigma-70 family)
VIAAATCNRRGDTLWLAWSAAFGAGGRRTGGAEPLAASDDAIADWVTRARGGDEDAVRSLYRAYSRRVYRTVRAMLDRDADAEDATQETFVRALEALDRYQARSGAPFWSWLVTIALNVARKRRRHRLRTVERAPEALSRATDDRQTTESDPLGRSLDRDRQRRALLTALEALAPREREVIALLYGAELDATEVGDRMDLTSANVRKIAERTRALLKDELARSGHEEHAP